MEAEEPTVVNIEDGKDNTFHCDRCSFKTHYYSRLVSHSVVHSNDRPYACEYCHYAAKRKSDLKKHHIHKHKLTDHQMNSSASSNHLDGPTSPSSSQHQQHSQQSIPITYSLSPEQEVTPSPKSIHDVPEEISIHSGSSTPSIKIELNDDVSEIRQYEYTIPLPTANSVTDTNPVAVNLPQLLFPHTYVPTSFAPTSSNMGSHVLHNLHNSSYNSSLNIQSIDSLKVNHTGQVLSSLTASGPVNLKDIATMTNQCFYCNHCNVLFFDNGLYVMHMGLHHSENPWQCNLCGQVHNDVYSFTLHFITQHKS